MDELVYMLLKRTQYVNDERESLPQKELDTHFILGLDNNYILAILIEIITWSGLPF
jgi:hypothetical protein